MKAYKGFNKNMTCRGFQYEEGKSYEMEDAKLCDHGFHACKYPLDCLGYYAPNESVYHVVEQENITEESGGDTKQVSSKIKIGARLDIAGLVAASMEYVKEKVEETNNATGEWSANSTTGYGSANSTTGEWSANSTTGEWSANSATGDRSANSATGNRSANSTTGYGSANSTTGEWSANSTTGNRSANSATGNGSANSTTGEWSANSATGNGSANSTTGDWSANSATGNGSANSATGNGSANSATGYGSANISTGIDCKNTSGQEGVISVGWGRNNKCRGAIGSYLVLVEREEGDGEKYPMIGEPVLVKVDGKKIKENVWYMLKNGAITEVD